MANLLAWCFHSPRRLAAIVVVLVAVLIGAGAVVRVLLPETESSPSATAGGVAGDSQDARAARQAAVTFVRAWASKPESWSAEQWRQRLIPLSTAGLSQGLAETDPATLPGGEPVGEPVIRFVSVASSLLEVSLSSGPRVLVTVVVVNGQWLVNDIQPLAGNPGAEAPSASGSAG